MLRCEVGTVVLLHAAIPPMHLVAGPHRPVYAGFIGVSGRTAASLTGAIRVACLCGWNGFRADLVVLGRRGRFAAELAGSVSVVRSGTSFRSQERPNGMTAIAIPQRKTPWSEWANACRKASCTAGGRCFACSGLRWTPPPSCAVDARRELRELVGEPGGEDRAEDRDAERAADRAEERRGRGRDADVLAAGRRSGRRARAPA